MPLTVVVGPLQAIFRNPRDCVTIKEGTPYTVPVSKIFMLTGLGVTTVPAGTSTLATLSVDDVVVLRGGIVGASQATVQAGTRFYSQVCSVADVPEGITMSAGQVITVSDNAVTSTGRAYGYLSDA